MKRFLYQPILDAIDAREARIAAELADAAARKAEAAKERSEFQHKNEVFDQQRAALLSQATDEANSERKRLLGLSTSRFESCKRGLRLSPRLGQQAPLRLLAQVRERQPGSQGSPQSPSSPCLGRPTLSGW